MSLCKAMPNNLNNSKLSSSIIRNSDNSDNLNLLSNSDNLNNSNLLNNSDKLNNNSIQIIEKFNNLTYFSITNIFSIILLLFILFIYKDKLLFLVTKNKYYGI